MKIVSVVGARPQFVKVAPIDWELEARGIEHDILHTGQHYDRALSEAFFDGLAIRAPRWNLGVGSASHAEQTAAMLVGCEQTFVEAQPDWVLCYGDTNSTVAAALAAAKLHIPIAHIEAGLRSFNRSMPEEHNRVVADHLCDLLFAPTDDAVRNLEGEGLGSRTVAVGDVMADVIAWVRATSNGEALSQRFVATIHRAENTDDPERLRSIVAALAELPDGVDLFAHPRLIARCDEHGISLDQGAINAEPPADYVGLMTRIRGARGVITDSGGLQKEAYLLGALCTTVRSETEWVETLHDGWNQLAEPSTLAETALRAAPDAEPNLSLFGDGRAAGEIIDALLRHATSDS